MKNKLALGFAALLTAALLPSVAFAEGGVKVECFGRCDLVNLGQICDAFSVNSTPVAVACDDTSYGNGVSHTCGSGLTCRPWGSYARFDLLSGYCDDGPGLDAVVTCRVPMTLSTRQAQDTEGKIEGKAEGKAEGNAEQKIDDGAGWQLFE